ncbi:hypothetical protein C0J52_09413 [Blattella germanica]|nr:hypothetical protein C0J52_09413 [Blattella germanica]
MVCLILNSNYFAWVDFYSNEHRVVLQEVSLLQHFVRNKSWKTKSKWRTEDGLLLNRERKKCCYTQKQRVHREVSVNILTQRRLQLKTQSIDCIDSLKLMKCQNQSNHALISNLKDVGNR